MPNSVTVRTSAPGAKETAKDLSDVLTKATGMGTGAKTALLGLGAAATVGFGLASKGALEAQDAQGKFMAATGKSRAEAKQFVSGMDALAGSAGAVGKGFEDIAATGTMVEQQFGTTGEKTTKLTGLILDFAKATRQDATQAAGDLEDTLSAYGLSADDAAGFTDALVLSTQKYGTEVGPEQLDLLRKISPALQSMGGDLNDAVGFLNLMETAGLDAADAQRGFNTALTKMPPGSTFDDILTHLGELKAQGIDPTTEAIKLFGIKAGPALAQAIEPGMAGLKDFEVQGDSTGQHVHDAAENMQTDAEKLQGIFQKIGAGARELGQDMGPALAGLGAIAPAMGAGVTKSLEFLKQTGAWKTAAAALGTAIGEAQALAQQGAAAGTEAIAALSAKIAAMGIPLAPAGTTVGTAVGSAMSAGMAASFLVGGAGLIAFGPAIFDKLTGNDVSSRVNAAGVDLANKFAAGYSDEVKANFATTFQDAFNQAMNQRSLWDKITNAGVQEAAQSAVTTAQTWLGTLSTTIADHAADDAREGMSQSGISTIFANDTALKNAGITAGRTINDGLVEGATTDAGWDAIAAAWIARGRAAGHEAGAAIPRSIALGMEQNIGDVRDEWKQYIKDLSDPFDAMKEISFLNGKLTGHKLAEGLQSSDPVTRARAEQMRDDIQARLNELKALGYDIGDGTGTQVAQGIDDSTPAAVEQADQLKNQVNAKLAQIQNRINIRVTRSNDVGGASDTGGVDTRASGGPVAGNKIYEVTEGGKPEMLESGGRNYLLMGNQPGYVRPIGGNGGGSAGGFPTTLRHEHFVHLDLQNTPPGITNEGVARIVEKVIGASDFAWQLEHAMSVAG